MLKQCVWLNEPNKWVLEHDTLSIVTDAGSDFWQTTHYGFKRDSGHLFGLMVEGDFTAQVHVNGDYKSLYDQAGLMVRIDEENWIKTGIEVSDGELMVGSVLTTGCSDWATGVFPDLGNGLWVRITLASEVMKIQWSADGKCWPLLRLCKFPNAQRYLVGPMCCSPEVGGLKAEFTGFMVTSPRLKDLHDLS